MGKRQKRSRFEEEMAEVLEPAGFEYEPWVTDYYVLSTYTPDFVMEEAGLAVECKGWFRPGDTKKYIAVAEGLAEDGLELVFLLQYPNKKVRKSTKITMSEWCEKEGFLWFACPEALSVYAYLEKGKRDANAG